MKAGAFGKKLNVTSLIDYLSENKQLQKLQTDGQ